LRSLSAASRESTTSAGTGPGRTVLTSGAASVAPAGDDRVVVGKRVPRTLATERIVRQQHYNLDYNELV
jgi:hypothetical protein